MSAGEYVPTIGLEIHAELKTRTKMFCDSKNDTDETRPNVNICPVCLAHPGTLPVINKEAVRHVLRVGVALGGTLADYTEFDRKNYFYPDLPKGYQISQYEYPLVRGGALKGVVVTRVHLEEDTASSTHDQGETTLVDFNRSGVPLMELVTEPVITSPEEAGAFARELQLLLRCLGASEANMEKGEMRVEANVSVAKATDNNQETRNNNRKMGTKVEIKNLNSFRAMERAVAYEIRRQTELLKRGEKVAQETRGWDEGKQATFPQRTKEGSADYRYFPDPDLPSLRISEVEGFSAGSLRADMPELPEERRRRYLELGVRREDAESFVADGRLGAFFEEVIRGFAGDPRRTVLASNYVANDLVRSIRDIESRGTQEDAEIPISAQNFRKIIEMLAEKTISSRAGKDLIAEAIKNGADPEVVARERGLFHSEGTDEADAIVEKILAENQAVVADYRGGKATALEYLVGLSMRALKGAGDPQAIRERIREIIRGRE